MKFGYDYMKVRDIVKSFGPKAKKSAYRNWFRNLECEDEMVMILSEEGGYGWRNEREFGEKCDAHGWDEIVKINEYNEDTKETKDRINSEIAHPCKRIVFWREKRGSASWYKFYGVFSADLEETRETLGSENPHVVYKKISDEYGI